MLTGLAMYADLQDPTNTRELAMARIRSVVPPALDADRRRQPRQGKLPVQLRQAAAQQPPDNQQHHQQKPQYNPKRTQQPTQHRPTPGSGSVAIVDSL